MFRRPPDPAVEARCEKLLAELTVSPRHWLPLGQFETRRAKSMYLHAGMHGDWDLYERSEDGRIELGMEPRVFRVFERDGYLRVRVRETPELAIEPIPEPFATRLFEWVERAREGFGALLEGRRALTLQHGLGRIVCIDDHIWRAKGEHDALVSIDRMERANAARSSWEATVASEAPLWEDAERLRASVGAALDPEALLAGVLAGRVSIRLADPEERWVYRRDDGSLVAWAPTGEVEIDGYPGCPPFVDPVDRPIYAQTPYAMEMLVSELHTQGRVEGVVFGKRPGND